MSNWTNAEYRGRAEYQSVLKLDHVMRGEWSDIVESALREGHGLHHEVLSREVRALHQYLEATEKNLAMRNEELDDCKRCSERYEKKMRVEVSELKDDVSFQAGRAERYSEHLEYANRLLEKSAALLEDSLGPDALNRLKEMVKAETDAKTKKQEETEP